MRFSRPLLDACTAAFAAVMPLHEPADAALSSFFRGRPKIGQRDRATIADSVYAALRRRRLLQGLVGTSSSPRRWVLATWTILLGASLREIEPWLRGEEARWLAAVKEAAAAEQPFGVQCELPEWVIERLSRRFSASALLELARGLARSATLDLRVNTMKMTREAALTRLSDDGIPGSATRYSPEGVRLDARPAINRHPLFLEGSVEVQDEGSQLLCHLVAPKRGEMVVDFCAGAGGKTLALGALMRSTGRLYAFDISPKRLASLKPRLARSGLSNVHPQRIEGARDPRVKRLAGKIDRVLVDAPCSGLGTLRRNPDMKWRQTPEDVGELAGKQASLLAAAATLVKPGGRLVYATCSILEEENRAVAEAFLAGNLEFGLLPAAKVLERERIDLNMGDYFEVWPHLHGTDGFFAAVFERGLDRRASASA
ncbi:MAG TPA: RsmB/NOP family class I SAM-dependent RNA methyltransferase [Burkholderiales bacterium]|nr:RsmB/NOP family class I SAM-dependent RNA methyltransferase [Burkholderiales bacterium]